MASSDKLIKQLIEEIEGATDQFQKDIPIAQREVLKDVLKLSDEFYMPARTVSQQAHNLKILSKIKAKINTTIITDTYYDSLKQYIKAFDTVENIQREYFREVFSKSVSQIRILEQIKKTSINLTIENLTGEGFTNLISGKVTEILNKNITSGGSYSGMVSELKEYLTEKDGGAMVKYAKQITTDALNRYSAQYTKAVTEDLGLEWYIYVGPLIERSRPFCKALIKAKNDCLPFIHKSQLTEIAQGHICGDVVSKAGMYDTTTGDTLQIDRGGYNCGHQLIPVSEAVVPPELVSQFSGS